MEAGNSGQWDVAGGGELEVDDAAGSEEVGWMQGTRGGWDAAGSGEGLVIGARRRAGKSMVRCTGRGGRRFFSDRNQTTDRIFFTYERFFYVPRFCDHHDLKPYY
jgi:hypothetical protein